MPAGNRTASSISQSETTPVPGQFLVSHWSVRGQSVVSALSLRGQSLASPWSVSGQSLVGPWSLRGQSLVSVRRRQARPVIACSDRAMSRQSSRSRDSPAHERRSATRSRFHHQFHVADEGRRVVAPPCPRSTARLQRSPIGRVESFRSWSTHLFRGRPGGRRHVRSGGRLSDTLMWS